MSDKWRFNRQRYDADQVITNFAVCPDHETDLAALQARIVGVVAETIQPKQVTMWVRGAQPARRRTEASSNR